MEEEIMLEKIAAIAAVAMYILITLGMTLVISDIIAEKKHRKKVHKEILKRALENECFAGEELIREADMLMHDETQSDEAIDFARRVYLIGRTAQEAKERTEVKTDSSRSRPRLAR